MEYLQLVVRKNKKKVSKKAKPFEFRLLLVCGVYRTRQWVLVYPR